jgi:hypothetical protein
LCSYIFSESTQSTVVVATSSVRIVAFTILVILVIAGIPTANAEGFSWSPVTSPTDSKLMSVFMVSATDGWAVAWYGTILHYSGGSWSLYTATNPTGQPLTSVFMVSATDGWAVGHRGTILHYTDGSWSAVPSPTTNSLYSVSMVSGSDGWAVGASGKMLHFTGAPTPQATTPPQGATPQGAQPPAGGSIGIGVAVTLMGIGAGIGVAGAGLALTMRGRRYPEVFVHEGRYYCARHRVPLQHVQGRLRCPADGKFLQA